MAQIMKVEGFGKIAATPNMMRFVCDIREDGSTYSKSHEQLIETYQKIVGAFKKVQFNVTKLKTSSVNISIITDKEDQRSYRSSMSIIYEDRIDLTRMNELLDALRVVDNFTFDLSYFIKDTTKFDYDALILAVNDATDKAKVIASASGVKLGSIHHIEYGDSEMIGMARSMSMDASYMSPSDLKISQRVTISWEMK